MARLRGSEQLPRPVLAAVRRVVAAVAGDRASQVLVGERGHDRGHDDTRDDQDDKEHENSADQGLAAKDRPNDLRLSLSVRRVLPGLRVVTIQPFPEELLDVTPEPVPRLIAARCPLPVLAEVQGFLEEADGGVQVAAHGLRLSLSE